MKLKTKLNGLNGRRSLIPGEKAKMKNKQK